MLLRLNHAQRLNLKVLLGNLRINTVATIRQVWRLQDKLMLTKEEMALIDCKTQEIDGTECYRWDVTRHLPTINLEITGIELDLINNALAASQLAPACRVWLEPLLNQLENLAAQPKEEKANAVD